ncbi:MAG TPA: tetratricopeptide repeat protein [Bryobacteraceae bacterium]|jgi:serine/threonine-protein kinase PknG
MSGEKCQRRGCTGVIEDGYCNACGLADPVRTAARMSGGGGTAVAAAMSSHQPSVRTAAGSSVAAMSGTRSTGISASTGSSPASHTGTRRSSSRGSRSSRTQLGAGLITLPDLPSTEPEKQILLDPKVPESKRFCSKCDNALTRERGFCGKCGTKYSFIPSLVPKDVIGGQYEVKGAMAYGGLGWIYLGFDTVLKRYVVLKGLLNAEDEASAAVAVAERQFLAAVKHPNIVGIYNFVRHGAEGYIVMEYVGGKTLKQIRKERGPLPPSEAIAYIHRILGAFAYLHAQGLVYCDFKPDNVMLEVNDVKLIDLGGVRRINDLDGDIYGTTGYTAPEAGRGPTVVSDLFTIGRTLAVLVTEFKGFTRDFQYTLPAAADDPVYSKNESLYRALLKSTAPEPSDRFQTADEMADQLLGVMREVVAAESSTPHPAASLLFGADLLALDHDHDLEPVEANADQIPIPTPDQSDPGFRVSLTANSISDRGRRLVALRQYSKQLPTSAELKLQLAATAIDVGSFAEASQLLGELGQQDAWDWRVSWQRGRLHFAQFEFALAIKEFDQVYFDLPGELAPKLAMGLAAEKAGDFKLAGLMYSIVVRTDPSFLAAVFGLARAYLMLGRRKDAIAVLAQVPESSSLYQRARVTAVRMMVDARQTEPGPEDFAAASQSLEAMSLDAVDVRKMQRQLFERAIYQLTQNKMKPARHLQAAGYPLEERPLRFGLEKCLRDLAHLSEGDEKIRLVDMANRARPRTLF